MKNKSKFEIITNILYDWLVIPFILEVAIVYLNTVCNTKFTNILSYIVCGFGSLICIFVAVTKIIKAIANDKKVIILLVLSVGFIICSLITAISPDTRLSNILFYIGIGCLELQILYDIICTIFMDNKKKSSIIKIIIFAALFVIIGFLIIYLSSYNNETLYNSLINVFAAIVSGGLTLGGVAWTIKHEKIKNAEQREYEILQTSPVIYLKGIDKIKYDEASIIVTGNNILKLNTDNIDKANCSIFFRFLFGNNNQSPIKQISIKSMTIYTNFIDQNNIGKEYYFNNNIDISSNDHNVSIIENEIYQTAVHLAADDKNIQDLRKNLDNNNTFIVLRYTAVNINDVCCTYELKLQCKLFNDNNEFNVLYINNISNWILDKPYILKDKQQN